MKKLFITILLLPRIAIADPIPAGCYVAASDPSVCADVSNNGLAWNTSDHEVNKYGPVMAFLIKTYALKDDVQTRRIRELRKRLHNCKIERGRNEKSKRH